MILIVRHISVVRGIDSKPENKLEIQTKNKNKVKVKIRHFLCMSKTYVHRMTSALSESIYTYEVSVYLLG